MKKTRYNKDKISNMLNSSDIAPQRAIVALYHRQTFQEKLERRTIDNNKRGFDQDDAEEASDLAEHFIAPRQARRKAFFGPLCRGGVGIKDPMTWNRWWCKRVGARWQTLEEAREDQRRASAEWKAKVERARKIAMKYAWQLARIANENQKRPKNKHQWENAHNMEFQRKHASWGKPLPDRPKPEWKLIGHDIRDGGHLWGELWKCGDKIEFRACGASSYPINDFF